MYTIQPYRSAQSFVVVGPTGLIVDGPCSKHKAQRLADELNDMYAEGGMTDREKAIGAENVDREINQYVALLEAATDPRDIQIYRDVIAALEVRAYAYH